MILRVFEAKIQANPALGWLGAIVAEILAGFGWFVHHAGDIGAIFGLVAAVFGAIAGWYTMRIQRRAWKRNGEPPYYIDRPRKWYQREK
jgi:hypothetical protein